MKMMCGIRETTDGNYPFSNVQDDMNYQMNEYLLSILTSFVIFVEKQKITTPPPQ